MQSRTSSHAFYGCSGLTSVTIPVSVKDIGKEAFYNCSSATVTVEATMPPTLYYDAFTYNAFNAVVKIYVPSDSLDSYKNAWSHYAAKIYAIPTN